MATVYTIAEYEDTIERLIEERDKLKRENKELREIIRKRDMAEENRILDSWKSWFLDRQERENNEREQEEKGINK